MRFLVFVVVSVLFFNEALCAAPSTIVPQPGSWLQWASDSRHSGRSLASSRRPLRILDTILIDPTVPEQVQFSGEHIYSRYSVPLTPTNNTVYTGYIRGNFDPYTYASRSFRYQRLDLVNGLHRRAWTFSSNWKPPGAPVDTFFTPLFQGSIGNGVLYVPGARATIFVLNPVNGSVIRTIRPFNDNDAAKFIVGPITISTTGDLVFNVVKFQDAIAPYRFPVVDSWLVKVPVIGAIRSVSFKRLVPGAPSATDLCEFVVCGGLRPGNSITPAIDTNGVIYTAVKAHFNDRYSWLVAVKPDMTPYWAASLRSILAEPARVSDQSSSSPVVVPDGVLYGGLTYFNNFRGHLLKFSKTGVFRASYDFGWDITPAVHLSPNGRDYLVILKDQNYGLGPFYMTALNSSMQIVWQYKNTNTKECERLSNKTVVCESIPSNQQGFEWCINAPVIDRQGFIITFSEDGNVYRISPGGRSAERIFLDKAIGAVYTPMSIGPDGRIFAQNNGNMYVIGN
mmetsp:Transcript_9155/g.15022  ORF Transcript_9155/g.15022 Transcript_9155/m.15022 type:complete len:509 (-) Transcript_9155:474-2000(-)|eukprot:CAMPEP_0184644518 /NCGR_PEP_ID=MMETSP0308-20130426/1226_1 /TAXON_ID=38269 /ORGANISM="Gloeochaete witrockiana, Strain SAG 46.84" /LENGTH=508 /DNA_ID=CAMNT_0027073097 /DNA_START=121 /DNA_END=1647 /DNA_ORIENTATION=-